MLDYTFVQEVKVLTGAGCVGKIGLVLQEAGYKKAFLVTTKGMVKRGVIGKIEECCKISGIETVVFDEILPDPSSKTVDCGAVICKQENCDCVVAVGGGSSLDAAKGINILRFNEGSILEYANKEIHKCSGLITVPTTSGTGSELSNGAIISDEKNNVKFPIACANCMSEYTILDPELTVSMPAKVTLDTGLDVFSHAVEAYTSVLSNGMTDLVCETVMETVVRYLPIACMDGNNMEAREKLQMAAAIGGWMLYNCCAHVGHSFAHVLGAKKHLVHGTACTYGLPSVLRAISEALPIKVKRIGEILGVHYVGTETQKEIGEMTAQAYLGFTDAMGLTRASSDMIREDEILNLAYEIEKEAFAGLCPVKVTKNLAEKIIRESFGKPERCDI